MKRSVGLAIVFTILCSSLFAASPEAPKPASKSQIAQFPMLMNIESLSFAIDRAGHEPNNPRVNWQLLQAQCMLRLQEVGIQVESPLPQTDSGQASSSSLPQLRTMITLIPVEQTQQYAIHIQTSLFRLVTLPQNSKYDFLAAVWNSSSVMKIVDAADANKAIVDTVAAQFEAFMHAHHAASVAAQAMHNEIPAAIAQKVSTRPAAVSAVATDSKFVASKNSKVFHKESCSVASRITSANVVTYASRSDAASNGKRPCKMCNP